MHYLNQLAALDKAKFEHESIDWKIVTSEECKRKHDFKNSEPAVKLIIQTQPDHSVLQAPADDLSLERLETWVTLNYVQVSMSWGRRANSLLQTG